MSGTRSASSPFRVFATALFKGFLWGLVCVCAITAFVMLSESVRNEVGFSSALRSTLETMAWTAMVASFLALFPVGPIAGVVAWQLYRRRIVSPFAYAAVGAFSTLVAPLIIVQLLRDSMRYEPAYNADFEDGVAFLILMGVAASGAFAGFMAGRIIRRSSAK